MGGAGTGTWALIVIIATQKVDLLGRGRLDISIPFDWNVTAADVVGASPRITFKTTDYKLMICFKPLTLPARLPPKR